MGRDEMDACSRRVNCTHASRRRESRRSEISSSGEVDGVFANGLGVVTGFAPALAAFLGFTAAFLGANVVLGSAFSGFALLSVAVTWDSLGALVTGWEMGLGGVERGALVFTTPPPRTKWLQFYPRSICSADGPARLAFGAAGWLVVTVRRP